MARLDGGGAGAAAPSSSAVGDTTVAAPMGKPMLEIFSHRAGQWADEDEIDISLTATENGFGYLKSWAHFFCYIF